MTGFGSAEGDVRDGRMRVEIRTVNHRFFNPQLKLPSDLQALEAEMRERLRELLGRGHVALTARWVERPSTQATLTVDLDRARAVVAALKQLKKALRLQGSADLAFVARHPDVLVAREGDEPTITWAEVRSLVEGAGQDVLAMREREGAALAADLGTRITALEELAARIAERVPSRRDAERDRLRRAVTELAAGVALDEQRLVTELAVMADRVDISEELVRLRTHLGLPRGAAGHRTGGEAAGLPGAGAGARDEYDRRESE